MHLSRRAAEHPLSFSGVLLRPTRCILVGMSNFRTPDGKILRDRSAAEDGDNTRIQLAIVRQEALDKATEINVRLVAERTELLTEIDDLRRRLTCVCLHELEDHGAGTYGCATCDCAIFHSLNRAANILPTRSEP